QPCSSGAATRRFAPSRSFGGTTACEAGPSGSLAGRPLARWYERLLAGWQARRAQELLCSAHEHVVGNVVQGRDSLADIAIDRREVESHTSRLAGAHNEVDGPGLCGFDPWRRHEQ